jgi:hypothetical protein
MADTFTSDPASLPVLTRTIVLAHPTTTAGTRVGPVFSDATARAWLDAIKAIEAKLTAVYGAANSW